MGADERAKLAELIARVEEMRMHHCHRSFGGQCDLCELLAAYDALRKPPARKREGGEE